MDDLEDVAQRLAEAARKAPALAGQAIRKTAFDIQADAKVLAPFKTGNLKGSIGVETPEPLTAKVYVTAEYGRFVEEGTAPHEIRPKKPGGVLAFPGGGGGMVFTSRVSHPGTKAQPYITPSVERRLPGLIQAAGDIVSRIL